MNKLNHIKLPKDKVLELIDKLYTLNSFISLAWIGLNVYPKKEDILYLNKLLGETIKFLRNDGNDGEKQ